MAEKVGEVYIEIKARAEALERELEAIKSRIGTTARSMEAQFARARINIDNRMMTRSIGEIERMHGALKTKLQQKIEMKADSASILRTNNALGAVSAKLTELKGIAASTGGPSGMGGVFTYFSKGVGSAIASMAAAVGALAVFRKSVHFVSESLEKWEDRKRQIKGVEQTIRSMGREGEMTARSILRMAEEAQKFNKYAVSVGDVLSMSSYLLTFEKLNNQTLPRATQVVIDLSQKMNSDLKTAAIAVGIALDNPAEGLMRLGRAGVKFSQDERKAIQALVESGQEAEAQEAIFDKLEKKIGGFTRATVDDLDNYTGMLSAAISKIQRSIGKLVEGALEPLAEGMTRMIPRDVVRQYMELGGHMESMRDRALPLIKLFEELTVTQGESEEKAKQLQDVTQQLADLFPGAITRWDEYGNAIDISTGKIWDHLEAEKEMSRFMKRRAIEEAEERLLKQRAGMEDLQSQLKSGKKTVYERRGPFMQTAREADLTEKEMEELNQQIIDTGESIKQLEDDLRRMRADVFGKPYGPMPPGEGKMSDAALKYKLESDRKYMAARLALARLGLATEYNMALQAIDDEKTIALQALEDEQKTSTDKTIDYTTARLAIETEYQAKRLALNRATLEKIAKEERQHKTGKILEVVNVPDTVPTDLKDLENAQAIVDDLANGMVSSWTSALDEMLTGTINWGQGITAVFTGFASSVIATIERILAKYAAMQALMALSNIPGLGWIGPIVKAAGAHSGGEFVGMPGGVKRMASGGSFIVPPGFHNDSYPLMVESGERVNVTPAATVGRENADIVKQLQVINANLSSQSRKVAELSVHVKGEISGEDIFLSNRKASRTYGRSR